MLPTYLFAGVFLLIGGFVGHQPYIRIEKLNKSVILNTLLLVTVFFTLLMAAYITGYFSHSLAASFMITLYSFLTGFFTGYAIRLIQLRAGAGDILYMHRSFWIDHAPGFAAVLIILYGIYRTSLLIEQPVTGIRLTSGISLMAFGFFGLTFKIIPEFRLRGILFLDKIVTWKQIIAWKWHTENVINIEFIYKPGEDDEEVRELLTTIPPEDRRQIETVLESKMNEALKDREKLLGVNKK